GEEPGPGPEVLRPHVLERVRVAALGAELLHAGDVPVELRGLARWEVGVGLAGLLADLDTGGLGDGVGRPGARLGDEGGVGGVRATETLGRLVVLAGHGGGAGGPGEALPEIPEVDGLLLHLEDGPGAVAVGEVEGV